jgi:hypothetical protein
VTDDFRVNDARRAIVERLLQSRGELRADDFKFNIVRRPTFCATLVTRGNGSALSRTPDWGKMTPEVPLSGECEFSDVHTGACSLAHGV